MTPRRPDYVDDPLHIDARGHTATTDRNGWLRDLIWAVLFTSPGERVHRDFGSGLLQLPFAPENAELAATVQFLVQSSLQTWLGHLIEVGAIDVEALESSMVITVTYTVRDTGDQRVDQFTTASAT
jgi:phage baseplate assembly protein W